MTIYNHPAAIILSLIGIGLVVYGMVVFRPDFVVIGLVPVFIAAILIFFPDGD